MRARSLSEVEKSWSAIDGIRKVSDRVIGLGPFGIGLDGLISLSTATGVAAPFGIAASTLYTWGAGGFLLYHALRVRASTWTVVKVLTYLALDTVAGAIPFVSAVTDLFFQGHLYAARAIQKEIERTHWIEGGLGAARADGLLDGHLADMRTRKKKRLVYLGA